jgi:hypothetical protein
VEVVMAARRISSLLSRSLSAPSASTPLLLSRGTFISFVSCSFLLPFRLLKFYCSFLQLQLLYAVNIFFS